MMMKMMMMMGVSKKRISDKYTGYDIVILIMMIMVLMMMVMMMSKMKGMMICDNTARNKMTMLRRIIMIMIN